MKKDLFYFSTIFCFILAIGIGTGFFLYNYFHKDELNSLISRANIISSLIDLDQLSTLSITTPDVSNQNYLNLKNSLIKISSYNSDTRFTYVMVQKEKKIYFIADSEPASSPDSSPLGQQYTEAPTGLYDTFNKGEAHTLGPYTDRWGSWISAFVPVFDSSGNVIYAVGIDIDSAAHYRILYSVILLTSIVTIFFLIIIIATYRLRKKEKKIIQIKSDFITLAAHELRSPLSLMRWRLSMLVENSEINENVKKEIEEIKISTLRLITMTNSVLVTTATEHNIIDHQKFQLVDVSISIVKAIEALKDMQKQKNISINLSEYLKKPCLVLGEIEKLELVFINLLSNSIKYSPQGSTVFVTLSSEGLKKVIVIEDQGIGISKKEIKNIFDGFFRAENAKRSGVRGSGFGLYMTKKIIEFFGGVIECSSEINKGTTFKVTLNTK